MDRMNSGWNAWKRTVFDQEKNIKDTRYTFKKCYTLKELEYIFVLLGHFREHTVHTPVYS
jgi:hypothetical protein